MNRISLALALSINIALCVADNAGTLNISQMNVNKGDEQLTLNMTVDPKGFHLKRNEIVTLTPRIIAGEDTLSMPSVRIAGKEAWYDEIRSGKATPFTLARAGKAEPIAYSGTVDFGEEFINSQVVVTADTVSVCNCRPPKHGAVPVVNLDFRPFEPTLSYHYVAPTDSAEKIFNLSGKANVIFKVNRTEIDWSYAGNYAELDTILRTINAVRDNPDATVESITLTGYASPEGSYANNVRLAKGRTEAVKNYVQANSTFPASVYHTSSVPEDWEGLLAWLEQSNIPKRDELIAFVKDSSIPVEKRNDVLRARFPEEYAFLLANVYPSLRHTDYKITYKIRRYYDVDEIRKVMNTNPRNLSLNELFLLANSCEPGSAEYDEVFSLAARLYPDSRVANLNAANSAINRGQYAEAERYLSRTGESAETDYVRGVLAIKRGNIDEAEGFLIKAKNGGIREAQGALDEIAKFRAKKGEIEIL